MCGDDGESHLGDFVADQPAYAPGHLSGYVSGDLAEDTVSYALLKAEVASMLEGLPAREREVIRLRFGLDDGRQRTLDEIGREFGLSRERIRQIEKVTMAKLRHPSRTERLKAYVS